MSARKWIVVETGQDTGNMGEPWATLVNKRTYDSKKEAFAAMKEYICKSNNVNTIDELRDLDGIESVGWPENPDKATAKWGLAYVTDFEGTVYYNIEEISCPQLAQNVKLSKEKQDHLDDLNRQLESIQKLREETKKKLCRLHLDCENVSKEMGKVEHDARTPFITEIESLKEKMDEKVENAVRELKKRKRELDRDIYEEQEYASRLKRLQDRIEEDIMNP